MDAAHDDRRDIVSRIEFRLGPPDGGRTGMATRAHLAQSLTESTQGRLEHPPLIMYETILIPTDGSECATHAIAHGLDVARRYDATVHALSVIDTAELLELGFAGDRSDFENTIEPLEDAAKRAVRSVEAHPNSDDLDVVAVVREGAPAETIVGYADDSDVDLIVMGTHGRRGVERYLLGSVTERVLRTADVPVLAVGPSDGEG